MSPAPTTLFRGVEKLPPGHTLTVDPDGRLRAEQYWDPLFPDGDVSAMSEGDIVDRLRVLLTESIALRTMGDVPFGALLSIAW